MSNTLDYRVVYLRPNPISDEAIAVAVIYTLESATCVHYTSHPKAVTRLDSLYGISARKRILEALHIFNELVSNEKPHLNAVTAPIDLFTIGDIDSFYTEHPSVEAKYILREVSSLYTGVSTEKGGTEDQISQKIFANRLRDEVSFHNVMAATTLFRGHSVSLGFNQIIKIPIYGDKIAGVAVSFQGPNPSSTKTTTEAFIARMLVARKQLSRNAVVYSLLPSLSETSNQSLVEKCTEELRLIGEEANITIRSERSVRELAFSILRDDDKLLAA